MMDCTMAVSLGSSGVSSTKPLSIFSRRAEPLEVGQARIAGAKVVDGKAHTQLHDLGHAGDGVVQVFDQQAFGSPP